MSDKEKDQGEDGMSVGNHRDALSDSDERSFRSPALSLSNQVISNLERRGLAIATEVQLQVIPKVRNERGTDLCINSPTGSGKTLAYALPIVEYLSRRLYTALGCVVVVPTRELVQQVRGVFDMCVRKMNLKVEVAQGQRSFAEEQEKLAFSLETSTNCNSGTNIGGNMLIDILIATPGRLTEHILHTPGFTLQHLRFLVLDEADRLLHQSFQNWIEVIMREISSPKVLETPLDIQEYILSDKQLPIIGQRHINSLFKRRFSSVRNVRKIILSATMTYDIGKLTSLQLHSPEIISVQAAPEISSAPEKTDDDAVFSVPSTLHEYSVRVTDEKPLFLLYLLDKYKLQKKTLIFTHSTETATRLNHFLTESYKSSHSDVTTAVISSEVPLKSRKKLLSSFISGKLNIVITTDLLSRGMDIKGVEHVVNYDSPPTARVYVHRAGRTARAGQHGDVWTLVTNKEDKWFGESVISGIQRSSKVEPVKIVRDEIPYASWEF